MVSAQYFATCSMILGCLTYTRTLLLDYQQLSVPAVQAYTGGSAPQVSATRAEQDFGICSHEGFMLSLSLLLNMFLLTLDCC